MTRMTGAAVDVALTYLRLPRPNPTSNARPDTELAAPPPISGKRSLRSRLAVVLLCVLLPIVVAWGCVLAATIGWLCWSLLARLTW